MGRALKNGYKICKKQAGERSLAFFVHFTLSIYRGNVI